MTRKQKRIRKSNAVYRRRYKKRHPSRVKKQNRANYLRHPREETRPGQRPSCSQPRSVFDHPNAGGRRES